MIRRILAATLAPLAAAGIALGTEARRGAMGAAQRVWQADVSVQAFDVGSMKPGGPITARVAIAADSDAARAVRVEIILPVGAAVLRVPDVCQASPGPVATLSARVTCSLGDVPVRGLRDVSIAVTAPTNPGRLRFAAFAFSDTPDPVPTNNFVERVLP